MENKIERYLVFKDKNGEDIAVENPEYIKKIQNEKYDLFLNKSGIPSFYHDIDFKDYCGQQHSEELRKIKYYADHCHEEKFKYVSLYLWGSQGTQKSALGCNILKHAMKNGLRCKFILASDLIDMLIKTSGYSKSEEIEEEIEYLKSCDLICIDDIGDLNKHITFNNSNHLINAEWDNFLRHVLSNGVKIVFTSNNSLEATKDIFGDSLYELLDRNVEIVHLTDSVKSKRKYKIKSVFEGI